MKPLYLIPALLLVIAACNKHHDSPSTPPGRLVSVKSFLNGQQTFTDTFVYNSNGYLISQQQNAGAHQLIVRFAYSSGNASPSSYSIQEDQNTPVTYTLNYDNQGRVIQDTAIPDIQKNSSTFYYGSNMIIYNSTGNGSSDTFYLNNNNVVKYVQGQLPADPSQNDITLFAYSPAYPNPFHTVGQNDNVRLLLTKIDNWELNGNDCISQNAYTGVNENGLSYTINYTTDAQGRVIKGTSMAGTTSGASVVYSYQ